MQDDELGCPTGPGDSGTEATRPDADKAFILADEDATYPAELPRYTCGTCEQEFGSNCDLDDIQCPWCEAQRCPHCLAWFGGEEGVISPDPRQVTVSREDLRAILEILADPDVLRSRLTGAQDRAAVRLSAAVEVTQ